MVLKRPAPGRPGAGPLSKEGSSPGNKTGSNPPVKPRGIVYLLNTITQYYNYDILLSMMQTMPQCTGDWSPFAGRRPALGHGVPAEGRHSGTESPAEGRHWPALGARRSDGLMAEGRRWLDRRPGTASRAVCARRSEQCAVYGAWLSSMRTLYILLLVYMNIR